METNNNDKIKKVLFNEISLALAIASTVFWLMNYINSPITKIQLDIALMQKDIQIISDAHIIYNKNADERDKAIIEIGKRLERIETILKEK